jgi:hypothetical protein
MKNQKKSRKRRSKCVGGVRSANLYLEVKMKLITPEFEALFKDYPLYAQDKEPIDPLVIAKLLDGSAIWYLVEYDPVDSSAFGFVTGLKEDKWVFVSVAEMENIEAGVARDMNFQKKRLSECLKK